MDKLPDSLQRVARDVSLNGLGSGTGHSLAQHHLEQGFLARWGSHLRVVFGDQLKPTMLVQDNISYNHGVWSLQQRLIETGYDERILV